MTDDRTYIKVHDGLPDHPKIEGLSDKAFRLLVGLWCWSSRHLTDGFVPDTTWNKRGTTRSRTELVETGLAEPVSGGFCMHDYLEHQRSAAEVEELKKKRREAGSKGGKAKATRLASATAKPKQTPSKPLAETETDTEKNPPTPRKRGAASDDDPSFAAFWKAYPRRTDKGHARRAWVAATRKVAEPETIIHAAEAFARRCTDVGTEARFIPHPATWLNGERWSDQPTQAAPSYRPGDAWMYE